MSTRFRFFFAEWGGFVARIRYLVTEIEAKIILGLRYLFFVFLWTLGWWHVEIEIVKTLRLLLVCAELYLIRCSTTPEVIKVIRICLLYLCVKLTRSSLKVNFWRSYLFLGCGRWLSRGKLEIDLRDSVGGICHHSLSIGLHVPTGHSARSAPSHGLPTHHNSVIIIGCDSFIHISIFVTPKAIPPLLALIRWPLRPPARCSHFFFKLLLLLHLFFHFLQSFLVEILVAKEFLGQLRWIRNVWLDVIRH